MRTGEDVLPVLAGFAGSAVAAGAIGPVQAERWLADQRRRAARDRAFLALPLFVAAARRE